MVNSKILLSLEERDVPRACAPGQQQRGPESPIVWNLKLKRLLDSAAPLQRLSLSSFLLLASGLLCTLCDYPHVLGKVGMSAG